MSKPNPSKTLLTLEQQSALDEFLSEIMKAQGIDKEKAKQFVIQWWLKEKEQKSPSQLSFNIKELKNMPFIPIDTETHEVLPLTIPDRLNQNEFISSVADPNTGDVLLSYKKEIGDIKISYLWVVPKSLVDKADIPSVGKLTRDIFISSIGFAIQQDTLSPTIKKEQQLELFGKEKKSWYYNKIDDAYNTLAHGTYVIEVNKKGKDYRREVGHFYNKVEWVGKGKDSHIVVHINEDFVKAAKAFIEKQKPPAFVPYPPKQLSAPSDEYFSRLQDYILNKDGLRTVYPISLKTLFLSILKIKEKNLKHKGPTEMLNILQTRLLKAKDEGILEKWEFIPPDDNFFSSKTAASLGIRPEYLKEEGPKLIYDKFKKAKELNLLITEKPESDYLNWKIELYLHKEKPLKEKPLPSEEQEQKLIDKIVNWHTYPIFNTQKSSAELASMLKNTIKKYGSKTIKNIFQQVANGSDPHPINFWKEISKLKTAS